MDKSDITHIRPVAVSGCTKRLAALADDFSKIVRLPLTTIARGGMLTANPSYSHTMFASSAVSQTACTLMESFFLIHSLVIPDALIAATALEQGLTLYTKNMRHFQMVLALKVVRPY